jgi:hypothetical protein
LNCQKFDFDKQGRQSTMEKTNTAATGESKNQHLAFVSKELAVSQ